MYVKAISDARMVTAETTLLQAIVVRTHVEDQHSTHSNNSRVFSSGVVCVWGGETSCASVFGGKTTFVSVMETKLTDARSVIDGRARMGKGGREAATAGKKGGRPNTP